MCTKLARSGTFTRRPPPCSHSESSTSTSCPALRYASTMWDPMKPAPPVTMIRTATFLNDLSWPRTDAEAADDPRLHLGSPVSRSCAMRPRQRGAPVLVVARTYRRAGARDTHDALVRHDARRSRRQRRAYDLYVRPRRRPAGAALAAPAACRRNA